MAQLVLVVVYVCIPWLALRMHPFWGVPVAILCLWIPVEAGVFSRVGVNPFLTATIAVAACLFAFRSRKDVLDIRSAFSIFDMEGDRAVKNFLMFAAIAIPLGLGIGFIRPVFNAAELPAAPLMFAATFFFNAIPEEILFRGLIQNWVEARMCNRPAALAVASAIFGCAHLNNGPPIPNYKYMLMATVAGVFYGWSWRARKNVLTSSLTHSLVNTGWNLFFR